MRTRRSRRSRPSQTCCRCRGLLQVRRPADLARIRSLNAHAASNSPERACRTHAAASRLSRSSTDAVDASAGDWALGSGVTTDLIGTKLGKLVRRFWRTRVMGFQPAALRCKTEREGHVEWLERHHLAVEP